jgi:hypothetical protein
LPGAQIAIVGVADAGEKLDVLTDNLRALKVLVTVPQADVDKLAGGSTAFQFVITDTADDSRTYHQAAFLGPNHD